MKVDANQFKPVLWSCYTAHFCQQLVSQCCCETSCPKITQCNMGCLAIFSPRSKRKKVRGKEGGGGGEEG